ncbi:transcriptional repressor AgaR [Flexithrix dorotheae]|uniref:transcriptional repressor AgaR n=1 Tax=Flexithrix dorotheae TaxID=70993 RepID=UPI00037FC306|nr:transcriptional repressor AgaR [Flexithrix dorotheae]
MDGENKSTVSRRIAILDKLNKNGQVTVSELSTALGVSEVTIRNDLTNLEKKNMLIRARGGAMKIKQNYVGLDHPLSDKQKKHLQEKKEIGKKAIEFIEEGNTIILDSGSTTYEVAKNFSKFEQLTVITNALNVATYLAEIKNINVIIPGGTLRPDSLSLTGILAEKGFRNYFCDKLFLGVDGFDIDHGISTPNIEEAHLNQIMIEVSKEVIVVADSSKFERRGFAFIAPVNKIDTVITDKGISLEKKEKMESLGIKVVIA